MSESPDTKELQARLGMSRSGRARRIGRWVVALLVLAFFAFTAGARGPADKAPAEVSASALPVEAQQTLRLIRAGGPFPYERDGVTFMNYERILPERPRGYYREYTVRTPGLRHRGARRIVAGSPGEYFYTEDHYRSFRRILE